MLLPCQNLGGTAVQLVGLGWEFFWVSPFRFSSFLGLQGECLKKPPPASPSQERNNMLEFEHAHFQVQKLSPRGPLCSGSCRLCLRMYIFFGVEVLFSISLLGESIIQLGSSIRFNDHPMNIR